MGHPGIFCDIPGQLGPETLVSFYSWDIPGYYVTSQDIPEYSVTSQDNWTLAS